MHRALTDRKNYRFGVFEFDVRQVELRKHGLRIRLREQPLQVLAALLERPSETVTREELHRRLWPADTFLDFDHSLNNAVNRLRDVLGDSSTRPRFIETVPRRGYRFLAPVEFISDARRATGIPSSSPTSRTRPVTRSLTIHYGRASRYSSNNRPSSALSRTSASSKLFV
jgi:cholera toxin transcriptional activator